jgi:hypothetical protein
MGQSSHGGLADRVTGIERMRSLVQPAAVWIGVAGGLVHIALTAPASLPADPPGGVEAIAQLVPPSSTEVALECRRASARRCDVDEAVGPGAAIAAAAR